MGTRLRRLRGQNSNLNGEQDGGLGLDRSAEGDREGGREDKIRELRQKVLWSMQAF